MRLFPQGVYIRSHTVWFWNNMMQSQNDTSEFWNNMKEKGNEHKWKYPVFPTWQCVISEICNVVLKQHGKFQHHICSLETAIRPKSTLNNMPYFGHYKYHFRNHMCKFRIHAEKYETEFEFTGMVFETTWMIFESTWSEKIVVRLTQIWKNRCYMRKNSYQKISLFWVEATC